MSSKILWRFFVFVTLLLISFTAYFISEPGQVKAFSGVQCVGADSEMCTPAGPKEKGGHDGNKCATDVNNKYCVTGVCKAGKCEAQTFQDETGKQTAVGSPDATKDAASKAFRDLSAEEQQAQLAQNEKDLQAELHDPANMPEALKFDPNSKSTPMSSFGDEPPASGPGAVEAQVRAQQQVDNFNRTERALQSKGFITSSLELLGSIFRLGGSPLSSMGFGGGGSGSGGGSSNGASNFGSGNGSSFTTSGGGVVTGFTPVISGGFERITCPNCNGSNLNGQPTGVPGVTLGQTPTGVQQNPLTQADVVAQHQSAIGQFLEQSKQAIASGFPSLPSKEQIDSAFAGGFKNYQNGLGQGFGGTSLANLSSDNLSTQFADNAPRSDAGPTGTSSNDPPAAIDAAANDYNKGLDATTQDVNAARKDFFDQNPGCRTSSSDACLAGLSKAMNDAQEKGFAKSGLNNVDAAVQKRALEESVRNGLAGKELSPSEYLKQRYEILNGGKSNPTETGSIPRPRSDNQSTGVSTQVAQDAGSHNGSSNNSTPSSSGGDVPSPADEIFQHAVPGAPVPEGYENLPLPEKTPPNNSSDRFAVKVAENTQTANDGPPVDSNSTPRSYDTVGSLIKNKVGEAYDKVYAYLTGRAPTGAAGTGNESPQNPNFSAEPGFGATSPTSDQSAGKIFTGSCYGTTGCGDNPNSFDSKHTSWQGWNNGRLDPSSDLVLAVGQDKLADGTFHYGEKVLLTNESNGKQVEVTVADICGECNGKNRVDPTGAAAEALGYNGLAKLNVAPVVAKNTTNISSDFQAGKIPQDVVAQADQSTWNPNEQSIVQVVPSGQKLGPVYDTAELPKPSLINPLSSGDSNVFANIAPGQYAAQDVGTDAKQKAQFLQEGDGANYQTLENKAGTPRSAPFPQSSRSLVVVNRAGDVVDFSKDPSTAASAFASGKPINFDGEPIPKTVTVTPQSVDRQGNFPWDLNNSKYPPPLTGSSNDPSFRSAETPNILNAEYGRQSLSVAQAPAGNNSGSEVPLWGSSPTTIASNESPPNRPWAGTTPLGSGASPFNLAGNDAGGSSRSLVPIWGSSDNSPFTQASQSNSPLLDSSRLPAGNVTVAGDDSTNQQFWNGVFDHPGLPSNAQSGDIAKQIQRSPFSENAVVANNIPVGTAQSGGISDQAVRAGGTSFAQNGGTGDGSNQYTYPATPGYTSADAPLLPGVVAARNDAISSDLNGPVITPAPQGGTLTTARLGPPNSYFTDRSSGASFDGSSRLPSTGISIATLKASPFGLSEMPSPVIATVADVKSAPIADSVHFDKISASPFDLGSYKVSFPQAETIGTNNTGITSPNPSAPPSPISFSPSPSTLPEVAPPPSQDVLPPVSISQSPPANSHINVAQSGPAQPVALPEKIPAILDSSKNPPPKAVAGNVPPPVVPPSVNRPVQASMGGGFNFGSILGSLGQMLSSLFGGGSGSGSGSASPKPITPTPAGTTNPTPVTSSTATVSTNKPILSVIANPSTIESGAQSEISWAGVKWTNDATTRCGVFGPFGKFAEGGPNGKTSTPVFTRSSQIAVACVGLTAHDQVSRTITITVKGDSEKPLPAVIGKPSSRAQVNGTANVNVTPKAGGATTQAPNSFTSSTSSNESCDPNAADFIACLEAQMLPEDKLY